LKLPGSRRHRSVKALSKPINEFAESPQEIQAFLILLPPSQEKLCGIAAGQAKKKRFFSAWDVHFYYFLC
jgi:hypothetical protein